MKKFILTIFFIFSSALVSIAANYSLEITHPQASLTTANRYYKTYTGFEYKVRIGVIGGLYPYAYALSVAPSGMTINATTGVITWSNPIESGSPHNITVSVTDSESTNVTRSWTLTVSTSGFYFLDAVNGLTVAGGGLGTAVSPWKTLDDLLEAGEVSDNAQVFFKSGNYDLTGLTITSSGSSWERHEIGGSKPVIWLAYPGESPVINYASSGYADAKATLRFGQSDAYISGFEISNPWNFGLQIAGGDRVVIAWCNFHGLRNGQDGDNSAFIMTTGGSCAHSRDFLYIHNNAFSNVFTHTGDDGGAFLKHYGDDKLLIEENTFSNENGDNTAGKEGISLKDGNTNSWVRKNSVNYIMDHPIGGSADCNQNTNVEFNLVQNATGTGVEVNERLTETGASYYYRNTFVSRVRVSADSGDATFTFKNNVLINDDTTYDGLYYVTVTDATKIVRDGDLSGTAADGIIDSSGSLQGVYRTTYLGAKGWEIGSTTQTISGGVTLSGASLQ